MISAATSPKPGSWPSGGEVLQLLEIKLGIGGFKVVHEGLLRLLQERTINRGRLIRLLTEPIAGSHRLQVTGRPSRGGWRHAIEK